MFHWLKKHNKEGLEVPDNTPIEVTLRDKPLTLAEQIQRFTMNSEVAQRLRERNIDTFEEADDFDVDDPEINQNPSPYEDQFHGTAFKHLQTRLDEQKGGMVEEVPIDRIDRAKDRLRSIAKAQNEPTQPPKEEVNVKPVS